jgi:hypothetical protein
VSAFGDVRPWLRLTQQPCDDNRPECGMFYSGGRDRYKAKLRFSKEISASGYAESPWLSGVEHKLDQTHFPSEGQWTLHRPDCKSTAPDIFFLHRRLDETQSHAR